MPNLFGLSNVKIGTLLLPEKVITDKKISSCLEKNFWKIFDFWIITQKIIKNSKNILNAIPIIFAHFSIFLVVRHLMIGPLLLPEKIITEKETYLIRKV